MTGSIKGLLVARTYMEQGDGISSGRLATGDTRTILGYLPKLGMRSLAYLILFICLSWRTSAQEFTAEGQLEYTVHNPKGAVSFQLHKYFSIKRNGSKWLIRTSNLFTNEDVNNINIYQEAGSDGTNIFWVSVEDTNRIPKDISASVVGTVTEGIVPITDFSLASSVWLAYASLPYFKGVKDGQVKPVEFVSDKEFREKSIQAKWQINSESPEFIHSIAYHHDGTTTIIGDGEDRVVTYPKPYDQGFTGTSFISGEYTNIDGYSVPTFFQFSILRPGYGPTNSLGVFAGIQGKVTEFSAGVDIQSFYPETIRKTFVTDKRFQAMGMEDFSYIIEKGGSWLQLGSPELDQHIRYYQRNYAKLLSSKPTLKPTNKRIIVISLVLLISALFCVVLWRLSRANRSAP